MNMYRLKARWAVQQTPVRQGKKHYKEAVRLINSKGSQQVHRERRRASQ